MTGKFLSSRMVHEIKEYNALNNFGVSACGWASGHVKKDKTKVSCKNCIELSKKPA